MTPMPTLFYSETEVDRFREGIRERLREARHRLLSRASSDFLGGRSISPHAAPRIQYRFRPSGLVTSKVLDELVGPVVEIRDDRVMLLLQDKDGRSRRVWLKESILDLAVRPRDIVRGVVTREAAGLRIVWSRVEPPTPDRVAASLERVEQRFRELGIPSEAEARP